MGEIRHNGCLVPASVVDCPVGFVDLLPVYSPLLVEQWSEKLWQLAGWLCGHSAAGLDGIPPKVYRHAGPGLFQLLGRSAHQAFESGVPVT